MPQIASPPVLSPSVPLQPGWIQTTIDHSTNNLSLGKFILDLHTNGHPLTAQSSHDGLRLNGLVTVKVFQDVQIVMAESDSDDEISDGDEAVTDTDEPLAANQEPIPIENTANATDHVPATNPIDPMLEIFVTALNVDRPDDARAQFVTNIQAQEGSIPAALSPEFMVKNGVITAQGAHFHIILTFLQGEQIQAQIDCDSKKISLIKGHQH